MNGLHIGMAHDSYSHNIGTLRLCCCFYQLEEECEEEKQQTTATPTTTTLGWEHDFLLLSFQQEEGE